TEFQQTTASLDQQYKQIVKEAIQLRGERPLQVDEKAARVTQHHERFQKAQLERTEQTRQTESVKIKGLGEANSRRLAEDHNRNMERFEADHREKYQELEAEWKNKMLPLCEQIQT